MDTSLCRIKTLDNLYFQIYDAARRGLSDAEIALSLSIPRSTLTRWYHDDKELSGMIEAIRTTGPVRWVEDALVKVATGYETEEVALTMEGGEIVKEVVTRRQVKPDVAAIKYYLNNRGTNWADKVEIDTTQAINISFDPALKNI